MKPYRDQYGVWNVEGKPPKPLPAEFVEAVEDKVARSAGVGGWQHGPVFICEQANDEAIDWPAWMRGLDEHPKPAGVDELVAEGSRLAAELYEVSKKVKRLYGQG